MNAPEHSVTLPVPPRIPRYIATLNAMAEQHGLIVSLAIEPYDNYPELRLWRTGAGLRRRCLNWCSP